MSVHGCGFLVVKGRILSWRFFFFPFCNLVSFVFWQPKIPSVHSESL